MFLRQLLAAYQNFTPFNDKEAWLLYRIAAIAEAIGWTLLLIGIACKRLPLSWHDDPVAVAGRIHGTWFIVYIVACLVLGPSLHWSPIRTLIAGCFSMPPYGSILFERFEARRRRNLLSNRLYQTTVYARLIRT